MPIAQYIKSDLDAIDYLVTGSPVIAGTPVLVSPQNYGIPAVDAPVGTTVALRVRGIFAIDKTDPEAEFAIGTMLDFDGVGLVASAVGTFRCVAHCPAGALKVCVRINVEVGSGGGGGGPTSWGFITGTLSAQSDLNTALNNKAAASHTHTFASLTSKPTTLSGYGISDAAPAAHTHSFASITSTPTTLAGYGISDAAAASHTHTFASLTSTPTTLSGYGITDAAVAGHTHTFASLTSKPTTLAGYGITDAQAILTANSVPLDRLANATAGSQLMGRRAGSGGAWEPISLGTNLSMSGTTINASGVGGGSDPAGLFPVTASGVAATDNANIAAAVASAIAYGDGSIIEFRGTDANPEINVTSNHATGTVAVSLRAGPGFEGLVYNNSSAGFFLGGDYYPWTFAGVGRIGGGVARNADQISDPSRFRLRVTATAGNYTLTLNGLTTGNIAFNADQTAVQNAINAVGGLNGNISVAGTYTAGVGGDFWINGIGTLIYDTTFAGTANNVSLTGGTATLTSTAFTVGKWYAFWSDSDVAEATWHDALNPMRPLEFHRVTRQVIEAKQFALSIAGTVTGGTYTLTINGLTTAAIAYNANNATVLAAINAVGGLNGNVTVTGSGPFVLDMVGSFRNQQNTFSVNPASLTGGATPRASTVATAVPGVNKWLLGDNMYDALGAGTTYYAEIPTVHNVRISGINVRCVDGMTPSGSTFYMGGLIDYVIEDCRIGNENGRNNPGVIFSNFCTGSMRNVQVYDFEDPNTSMAEYYGMGDAACNRIYRENCKFGAQRHSYTTYARARTIGGTTYRYGNNLNGFFQSCKFASNQRYVPATGANEQMPPFDTHAETSKLTLADCVFDVPANQVGLFIRGRDVTLNNATINCHDTAFPIVVMAKNFTMNGGVINGGFVSTVANYGTQPNVDNARFLGVTWKDCKYNVLRVETGTGFEVDSCKFLGSGSNVVNSPWSPSAPIYIKSLTNTTTARARITNNTAPKFSNADFLYPGNITLGQLYFAGNEGMSTYGGTSIGIARKRATHGTEGFGTSGAAIPLTIEWEMLYGHMNGQQKYLYRQKTGHGLTVADIGKPIALDITGTPTYSIYDDEADEQPIGLLVDVPHEGATDTNNFIVIAPHGFTTEIPKALVSSGTHSAGVDKPTGYWDLSAGGYVVTKPGTSHANALPVLDIASFTASLCQVRVAIPAVSGGSAPTYSTVVNDILDSPDLPAVYDALGFVESDLGTFGTSMQATDTAAEGLALFAAEVATFKNVTMLPVAITDSGSPAVNLDPSEGGIRTWSIGANRTPTATGFSTGESMLIHLSRSGAFDVTWTTVGVVWAGGTPPTIPASGAVPVILWKIGSVIYGTYLPAVA